MTLLGSRGEVTNRQRSQALMNTIFSVHYTLHSALCTLYPFHSTLHTPYFLYSSSAVRLLTSSNSSSRATNMSADRAFMVGLMPFLAWE